MGGGKEKERKGGKIVEEKGTEDISGADKQVRKRLGWFQGGSSTTGSLALRGNGKKGTGLHVLIS